MKILANDGISAKGKELLEKNGFEVLEVKVAQNQLIDYINKENIVGLLVRSATTARKELIDACPNLKLIGRGGVGMDNIDVDYAKSKGLYVINTPGASANSVAELVFAHLMGGVRFLHDANRNMPLEGDTQFSTLKKAYGKGIELQRRTMGIIGFGRIGQAVARIAIGLGMNISAHDPYVEKATISLSFFNGTKADFDITTVSKEEVLIQSDFITLHIPAQKQGYAIDHKELGMMKKGAGIINLARGGVINEEALLEALENEHIGFAALDVFESEPTPSIKLLMQPNISLSPHIGGATKEAQDRIGEELAEQIIELLK